MMLRKSRSNQRLNKSVSANRRKRMLSNNKKKIIWRNRAFVQMALITDE